DANIEDVNAFAFLLLGHLDEAVPVVLLEELLELARAVGVSPLADQEGPRVDHQLLRALEAGDRREVNRSPFCRRLASDAVDDRLHVLLCRTATPPDNVDAVLGGELPQPLGDRVRIHWKV